MIKFKQLKGSDVPKLRKQILQEQNGICPICKKEIQGPCLDHQHKKKIKGSGQIRGVLCRACNIFLGKAENNCVRFSISQKVLPSILRNIADYLEQKQYPYLHPSEKPKEPFLKRNSISKLTKLFKMEFPKRKVPTVLIYKIHKKGKKEGKIIEKKLTAGLKKIYALVDLEPEFKK